MKTIQQLIDTRKVASSGFPAIAGIGDHSIGEIPAVLSSLPAATLYAQGVTEYYALVMPRGVQFNTAADIIAANVPVQLFRIETVDTADMPIVLTTQHQATLDVLTGMYPDAEVLAQKQPDGSVRNLTPADVAGKHVIGVLPPFLIAAAGAFTSASIANYNAATDGDLSGDELRGRLQIAEQAITVKAVEQ